MEFFPKELFSFPIPIFYCF